VRVSAGLGENGLNCVEQILLAVTRYRGSAGSIQQQRAPGASDLNSVVRFNGRQLRYQNANACTEYEDESHV
jgi:hypothetical protein